jgi:hypothetical protein
VVVPAEVDYEREPVVGAEAARERSRIGRGRQLRRRKECGKDCSRQSGCKYKYYGKFGRFSHALSPRCYDMNPLVAGMVS